MSQNLHQDFALQITQTYPEDKFNLLVPMKTVTEIANIHKPVMNVVRISTDPNDKEIYEQEKAKEGYTDRGGRQHPPKPAGWALTKKGLNKLMRAAGIKILSTTPIIPSTCRKCGEMNKAIGRPVNCGACPNKDVAFECKISVPQLTGENITFVAHKEIIVDDVTAEMTDAQRKEFMKFRNEMCETKAINRALRAAMHIKGTYRLEEFKKPFVVAYLVPNLDDEQVKERAIESYFASSHDLFGGNEQAQATPEPKTTYYVPDDYDDEIMDAPDPIAIEQQNYELPPQPTQAQPQYRQAPQQQQPTQQYRQPAQPKQQPENICCDCGKTVTDGVIRYSKQAFGRVLCMTCQKKYGGAN